MSNKERSLQDIGRGAAESVLTKRQRLTFGPVPYPAYGPRALIKAEVRYDDECGNGHNTFAITGEIYIPRKRDCEACGMLHKEIARAFPELAPFLKWHLTSSDGPMHYVANTLYWLGYDTQWCDGRANSPPNLEHARSTAVWPDMPESLLAACPDAVSPIKERRANVAAILEGRQEALLADFRAAVESLAMRF